MDFDNHVVGHVTEV